MNAIMSIDRIANDVIATSSNVNACSQYALIHYLVKDLVFDPQEGVDLYPVEAYQYTAADGLVRYAAGDSFFTPPLVGSYETGAFYTINGVPVKCNQQNHGL